MNFRFILKFFQLTVLMMKAGEKLVRVGQDTRLNYRAIDLRTPSNQAVFRIQCQVENVSVPYYFIVNLLPFMYVLC
jgi:aspartyl/asparaginyl-tRNA synthetase